MYIMDIHSNRYLSFFCYPWQVFSIPFELNFFCVCRMNEFCYVQTCFNFTSQSKINSKGKPPQFNVHFSIDFKSIFRCLAIFIADHQRICLSPFSSFTSQILSLWFGFFFKSFIKTINIELEMGSLNPNSLESSLFSLAAKNLDKNP